MSCAVGLAAVLAALLFHFRVELGETLAFALGVFRAIQFGVGFGQVEVDFGAARVDLRSQL